MHVVIYLYIDDIHIQHRLICCVTIFNGYQLPLQVSMMRNGMTRCRTKDVSPRFVQHQTAFTYITCFRSFQHIFFARQSRLGHELMKALKSRVNPHCMSKPPAEA